MNKLRVFSGKGQPVTSSGNETTFAQPLTPISRTFSPSSPSSPGKSSINLSFTDLSPELVPIVTLLSAQLKRKYQEGSFMLLKDLDSDGNPSDRKWIEVFGILIGTQLTYWNADSINSKNSSNSKPSYINLSDSSFKICENLPSAGSNIKNVIVLSTTLKNRYLLQFSEPMEFQNWYSAFRLTAFEYKALQEAYTASLLSSRGSLLSNIRTILAEKKHNYEDWASVRFGAGMPWKRCYAVIEPSKKKRKSIEKGRIFFYENDKKNKKSLMATISIAEFVYAVYPRNYLVIDQSTMIKLDCKIQFDKKESPKDCSIFIMPEQHSAVPGYDTLIRFLIPVMDAFALYGRPSKLKAYKSDPESLLFALPVLPNLYYLDLKDLVESSSNTAWTQVQWDCHIRDILRIKMSKGYNGFTGPEKSALKDIQREIANAGGSVDTTQSLGSSPSLANAGLFTSASNSKSSLVNKSSPEKPLPRPEISVEKSSISNNNSSNSYYSPESRSDTSPMKLQIPSTANLERTPPTSGNVFDQSPSPQLVNIYTNYSQLPDNDIHNNLKRLNMKENASNEDLYPNKDDYDSDYSDDDDLDVFIAKPTSTPKDRNLSPFTAFNTSFSESMKPNIDYQHQNKGSVPITYTKKDNKLDSSINLAKQRSPVKLPARSPTRSPLKNNVIVSDSDNLYPTVSDEEDNDNIKSYKNEYGAIFNGEPPSSDFKDEEDELDFSPSFKQNSTFDKNQSYEKLLDSKNAYGHNTSAFAAKGKPEKIDTSLFNAPANPYLRQQVGPQTPVDQQDPPLVPGPIKQVHKQKHTYQQIAPNSYDRPRYNVNSANANGSPNMPQGFQQRAQQPHPQPPQSYYQHQSKQGSPGLIPPHQYQQRPQQNQQQISYGSSSPVNQFMPQFPKPGYGAQGPPLNHQNGYPNQQFGYQRNVYPANNPYARGQPQQMPRPQQQQMPPPQQQQYNGYMNPPYPIPNKMHRKPPPKAFGGQVISQSPPGSATTKSFKHDPYAIAKNQ